MTIDPHRYEKLEDEIYAASKLNFNILDKGGNVSVHKLDKVMSHLMRTVNLGIKMQTIVLEHVWEVSVQARKALEKEERE